MQLAAHAAYLFQQRKKTMELLPHQQRVVDEKTELDAKRASLETFLTSKTFRELDEKGQILLINQCSTMHTYSMYLAQRIALF